MSLDAGPALVAAWDVLKPEWWAGYQARSQWLKDHGLPADKMCRCEFWLLDAPVARIFGYAYDHTRYSPGWPNERVVMADVLISEFPPRELL